MSNSATAEEQTQGPGAGVIPCTECDATCPEGARFCAACGALQRPAPSIVSKAMNTAEVEGGHCRGCGEALGEAPGTFCRNCGQAVAERTSLVGAAGPSRGPGSAGAMAQCHQCGEAMTPERRFCAKCGSASRRFRGTTTDVLLNDPGWYRVVKGLGLVWEGHVTLIAAAVVATAVITVLSLVGPEWSKLEIVRAGLLGASGLAVVVGMVIALVGKAFCLAAPIGARTRVPTIVTLAIGSATAVLGGGVLIWMGLTGFSPERVTGSALILGGIYLMLFLAQMVAFSFLLRQMAFALRHYRIAQGSVGFIVFIGVGLAVVGMLNLLFQYARPAAKTFAELLAVAFALLTAFWYLNMVRRGRDLVRQRLP